MEIRETIDSEKFEIENIHKKAFGKEKGPEIAGLVHDLFSDKTADPLLSFVAVEEGCLVGHILYTKITLVENDEPVSALILAPLAVLPEFQKKGVGGLLIKKSLSRLKKEGVDLVFVLGHPDYYPRSGFTPAGVLGFEAPYPIPEEHAGAWMVQELSPGVLGRVKGRVKCSKVLDRPEHWRE